MREKILKQIFFLYSDKNLSEEAKKYFDSITEYISEITGKKEDERADDLLYDLIQSVFMDSANMLLDFISGKEGGAA